MTSSPEAHTLIETLQRRGVRVWLAGGRVRYEPWQAVRPSERQALSDLGASVREILGSTASRSSRPLARLFDCAAGGDEATSQRIPEPRPLTRVDCLERLFLARRGEWITARDLAAVAGFCGWRTRVADLRRRGYTIENRQRRTGAGRAVASEYRYPAEAALTISTGHDRD